MSDPLFFGGLPAGLTLSRPPPRGRERRAHSRTRPSPRPSPDHPGPPGTWASPYTEAALGRAPARPTTSLIPERSMPIKTVYKAQVEYLQILDETGKLDDKLAKDTLTD